MTEQYQAPTGAEHPITPPPELVQQWMRVGNMDIAPFHLAQALATRAARWGADVELEACCEWLNVFCPGSGGELRIARRSKPPSLKKQALAELAWVDKNLRMPLLDQCDAIHTIRRALEQLDD